VTLVRHSSPKDWRNPTCAAQRLVRPVRRGASRGTEADRVPKASYRINNATRSPSAASGSKTIIAPRAGSISWRTIRLSIANNSSDAGLSQHCFNLGATTIAPHGAVFPALCRRGHRLGGMGVRASRLLARPVIAQSRTTLIGTADHLPMPAFGRVMTCYGLRLRGTDARRRIGKPMRVWCVGRCRAVKRTAPYPPSRMESCLVSAEAPSR
jgi:hypothetical protein